jgi:photosystem II stability/assembly factor-like uncharacterized protein
VVTLPRGPADKPQETAVAVNPRDDRHVIVSYHQSVGELTDHHFGMPVEVHVAWSADGGATWTVAPGTTHPGYLRSLDATVTFDGHGHAFLSFLAMDSINMTARHGQFLRRSLDGGRTWGPLVTLIERPGGQEPVMEHFPNLFADRNAKSPHGGTVYLMWDRIMTPEKGVDLLLTRSTDDGASWSTPRVIGHHPGPVTHNAVVGPDGTIYLVSALGRPGADIMVSVSRDGGQTFGSPKPVARISSIRAQVAEFPRAYGIPLVSIDPNGKLFVAWTDGAGGDSDIMVATSDDGGATWSKPLRANDDAPSGRKDQVMHWLAVDPADGAAYLLFFDRRDDPNNRLATITLARSTDGGRTFTNYRWSVSPSDPNRASLGDYLGLAVLNGRVYGAWADNLPPPAVIPPNVPRSTAPGDSIYRSWPFGPSAIRVGIADFGGSGRSP